MPHRTMAEMLDAVGDDLLDDFDGLTREAHSTYRSCDPAVLIEHDVRAQANCTYSHMVASADRRFLGRPGIRPLDIRGLKLWLFETASVVVRFKKMDALETTLQSKREILTLNLNFLAFHRSR
jgi:hypothetical protein